VSQLVEKIAREIAEQGAMSFACFMDLALYCPVYGYYETEADTIGRRGDYYTSVSVGPVFGELLAWQMVQWLDEVGGKMLVEAGAHRGELARDILRWLQRWRSDVFEQLEYWIVEPSERRQGWQQKALGEYGNKLNWAKNLDELKGAVSNSQAGAGIRGVIFSNELLDAMPVHRLGWDADARAWIEWGVGTESGRFVWKRLGPFEGAIPAEFKSDEVRALLPDGYMIEVSPAAAGWWRNAARLLTAGKLVTLDYGFGAGELLSPARTRGTLRAYRKHRLSEDVLACPGEQDITAHVNFSAIQSGGEEAGLKTEEFLTQERFLSRLISKIGEAPSGFAEWSAERIRQFKTLIHPEHMGSRFKVLIQSTRS
jgi:SAM-dependent MidA family methyltransferase